MSTTHIFFPKQSGHYGKSNGYLSQSPLGGSISQSYKTLWEGGGNERGKDPEGSRDSTEKENHVLNKEKRRQHQKED